MESALKEVNSDELNPIEIAHEKCDLCGSCVGVCPPDCIIMTERALFIVAEKCIQCGICLVACPVGALTWINGKPKIESAGKEGDNGR